MRVFKTVGIAAIVLVAAILVYQIVVNDKHLPATPSTAQHSPDPLLAPEPQVDPSNTQTASTSTELNDKAADALDTKAQTVADANEGAAQPSSVNYPPLAAYDIANAPVEDQELIDLVERLNNDPVLLAALIDELRAETDPDRLKRLVYILGSTGNSEVLPAAEELIYSGSTNSRDIGLNLLSRISSKNPEAMVVASNLLVSETEPDVLIATMNVLAQPSNTDKELRDSLVTQITSLSTHDSTTVRSFTVTTLARLTNDPDVAPIFYNALFDSEPAVRTAGVYAYSGFPYHSAESSQKLLDMVEDESEHPKVRQGAILALSNNSPDELTKSRLDAAGLSIRQQARQRRLNGN